MTGRVTIFNDNVHPLAQLYKGEEVFIDSKDFWRDKKGNIKTFDIYEANEFRGTYYPRPSDGSGKMIEDSKYYKIIKIEPLDKEEALAAIKAPEIQVYKCMAKGCNNVFSSVEKLEAHTNAHHSNMDTLVLPDQDVALRAKQAKAK